MDIRDLPKVLVLICAVIYASTSTTFYRDGNLKGAQNHGTMLTSPKNGNYKLSYADYEITWKNFKLEHNKEYLSISEEKRRFAIFMDNVKSIEAHNMKYHLGQSTYWMDINQFSDWMQEDLEEWLGPQDVHTRSKRETGMVYHAVDDNKLPQTIDWRTKGFVTEVKDQGDCKSCYAFSTTGSIEGQWYRKTGKLINLSEQQIVDCSTAFGNNKCNGGQAIKSFNYIISTGGLQNEATYRYKAENGTCKFNKSLVVAQIKNYYTVDKNEAALKSAVGIEGPVSVSMFVNMNFVNYGGGIYNDPTCLRNQINHIVLAVGYGTSPSGSDYWIVKNCWNSTWGSNYAGDGYIKIARNTGGVGMCAIALRASFPVVSGDSTSYISTSDVSNNDLASRPDGSNKLESNVITVLVMSTLIFLKFTQQLLYF